MATLAPEPGGRPTAGQLSAKLRSLRYSLDVTVGDPATELAKIIDTAEEVERQSSQSLPSLPGAGKGGRAGRHVQPSVGIPAKQDRAIRANRNG